MSLHRSNRRTEELTLNAAETFLLISSLGVLLTTMVLIVQTI